jgi:hypothetical protein
MVNEGIRCVMCGMLSFAEPAQHDLDCPQHDHETCASCGLTHEQAEALRARLALAEKYVATFERLTGKPMSQGAVAELRAIAAHPAPVLVSLHRSTD